MSYALPTINKPGDIRSLSKSRIMNEIRTLYNTAESMPNHDFLISYNGNKLNLNGYTMKEMKYMFLNVGKIPENIIFNEDFINLTKKVVNKN